MESESHAHWIKRFKMPIVLWLSLTSFPTGFMPFFAASAYREIQHEQHVSPKWRIPARIENKKHMFRIGLQFSAAAGFVHLCMAGLALRKWNRLFLGLRGAGWFAMMWSAFLVGIALGIWIYATGAPV